jgi:potassium channel LctB
LTPFPSRRLDWLIDRIERHTFRVATLVFLVGYAGIALLFALGYFLLARIPGAQVFSGGNPSLGNCLYFSWVSQLTIGFGDLVPLGWARLLAVMQALAGWMMTGLWIGLAVLKLTSPSRCSIVFSNRAFYLEDEQRFAVMFVNANRQNLTHAHVSTNVKLAGQNLPGCDHTAPYVGESVWVLTVDCVYLGTIKESSLALTPGDGLKVSISGRYGFAGYARALLYHFDDVCVLKNRGQLRIHGFESPSFDAAFWASFNNPVPEAPNLVAYLKAGK